MSRRILIINGHPDSRPQRLCAALCDAYAEGALAAGHQIRRIDAGALGFPDLRTAVEFEDGVPPADILKAQAAIRWAEHILVVHPLWLGGAPAVLKSFLEQTFRYGFAIPRPGSGRMHGLLSGRSLRTVVTMGMPAPVYRRVFGAFGIRAEETGIFRLAGLGPLRHTLIGGVGTLSAERAASLLARLRRLGRSAA